MNPGFGNCSSFPQSRSQDVEIEKLYLLLNTSGLEDNRSFQDFFTFSDPVVAAKTFGLGLMMLFTIFGNLLVIVSVLPNPALRTPTHSLIVNLAIADLLLGMTVLPLSAARELAEGLWLLGPDLCSAWTTLDVLCCTASILSLCGISVDRYVGVSRPLSYSRIMTKRRVHSLIAAIWALALAISIAQPLGWKEEPKQLKKEKNECHVNKNLGYVIFSAFGSFYLPALVILVLYFLVYKAVVKHSEFMESGMKTTRSQCEKTQAEGVERHTYYNYKNPFENESKTKFVESYVLNTTNTSQVFEKGCSKDWKSVSERSRRLTLAGAYGKAAKFRRQKKAAKTLGIVVGCFLLCWFPFFIILPLDAACTSCHLSGTIFNLTFWLGYFNSCLNPFIYACSSRELRRAFRHILCCRRHLVRKKQINNSEH